jgi:hypothetical protein
MPPQMMAVEEQEEVENPPRPGQEPYHDHPDSPESKKSQKSPPRAVAPAGVLMGDERRRSFSDSDSESSDEDAFAYDTANRVSEIPPMLGPMGSRVSRRSTRGSRAPTIPRRSSRRTPSTEAAILENNARLSTIVDSPALPQSNQHLQADGGTLPIRLPFGSTDPSPERSPGNSAASSAYRQALAPPPVIAGSGRVSTGFVPGHRMQDSYHADGYDGADVEARAEIVDRSQSGSTHMSGRSRRLKHF